MSKFFRHNIFLLSILYIVVRLPFLTKLPIVNDESIYLDWGYRSTHVPGHLYYSLYDAKQPLMIWLFGISESIISDPLYAGRFISLMFGLSTMIGIYLLSKYLFNKKVALSTAILYTFIPIFTLFDRQALLESGVTAASVWSCYFLVKLIKEGNIKYSLFLGLVLGLGFFIKTTALLFFIATIIILLKEYFQKKDKIYFKYLGNIFATFVGTTILLLINPKFWEALSSNSRYVYTFSEILKFPVISWWRNITSTGDITFFFLTPVVTICALGGIYALFKNKKTFLLYWFIIPLVLYILTVKNPSQRYLVAFLPLLVIFSVYFIYYLFKKRHVLYNISLVLLLIIPVIASLTLIYSPITYFTFGKKVSVFSESSYIEGHLSGYGIKEAVDYIKNQAKTKKVVASYAENTGNPESAVIVYLQRNKEIPHAYIERRYFGEMINGKECMQLQSGHEVYFISRNEQQAGLENLLEKVATFEKPNKTDSIGVYHLKNSCKDPLIVNMVFNP